MATRGIDEPKVTAWLRERLPELREPLAFETVAAGRSNLTFVVRDADGRRWVLRRPPTGHVLASAHDMAREYRIIDALQVTDVPVPASIAICTDDEVNGAPFYVMGFVEGTIARNDAELGRFDVATRRRISESLVDTLAKLHRVDPDAVGLGDLAKKEDYLARQLKRWLGQVEKGSDRDLPRIAEVHAELVARTPEQQGAGIVHGDYRLDNCMIADDGSVAAVLDWELCTLGDVLADLGSLVMYWGDNAGFLTSDEVVARYAETSDRDLSQLPYYVAFANWRLACIVEGVRTRFAKGAMGDKDIGPELAGYEVMIDDLIETASSTLRQLD